MLRFLLALVILVQTSAPLLAQSAKSWVAGPTWEKLAINCDLPESQHMKNIGSRIDNAGMCVFSSIEMAARYQNLEQMRGWRDWCAQNYRGGGYPEKVDQLLTAWWKFKKIAPVPYLQVDGLSDPDELMTTIDRTNRMACITYGYSPRYGGRISHMTNVVLYGPTATVLDNNFIGDRNYEWMPKQELVRRMRLTAGTAWVFVWLTPGSPPPPKAKKFP